MPKQPLNSQDIVGLLSRLKDSTPDYPADLLSARRASFLQQATIIHIKGSGKGGGDGGLGGSGGSGALGGMTTAQTVLLQAVIGVWVVAAMLTAAYVFRDQIIDLLQDNGIVEVTQVPVLESTASAILPPTATETIVPTITVISPSVTAEPGNLPVIGATADGASGEQGTPEKDNPGLHLGQTPGAPDTPNQEKPDKPDKPDKTK